MTSQVSANLRGRHISDRSHLSQRDRSIVQTLAKLLAFEQLGYDERRALVFADIINGKNIWMVESRGRLSFLLETPQTIFIVGKISREQFDSHLTIKPRIVRAIHFAHSACADLRDDAVMRQGGVG
jgi:hypothetical protein